MMTLVPFIPDLIKAAAFIWNGERKLSLERWRLEQDSLKHQRSLEFDRWCVARSESFAQYALAARRETALQQDARREEFETWCQHQRETIERELAKYARETQRQSDERHLAFQRWRFEQERQWRQALAIFDNHTRLAIARDSHRAQLDSVEFQRTLQHFPLSLSPAQLLTIYDDYVGAKVQIAPMLIFVAPPPMGPGAPSDIPFGSLQSDVSERLRTILQTYNDEGRSNRLFGDAWQPHAGRGETAVEMIFRALRGIPTLVIETELSEHYLNLRFAYWSVQCKEFLYKPVISQFGYRDALMGDPSRAARRLVDYIAQLHCLVATHVLDLYYLTGPAMLRPLLPSLAGQLAAPDGDLDLGGLYRSYLEAYAGLAEHLPDRAPELLIEGALFPGCPLPLLRTRTNEAIRSWQNLYEPGRGSSDSDFDAVLRLLQVEDQPFAVRLLEAFTRLADERQHPLRALIAKWEYDKVVNASWFSP
jgi:hypothetical protein